MENSVPTQFHIIVQNASPTSHFKMHITFNNITLNVMRSKVCSFTIKMQMFYMSLVSKLRVYSHIYITQKLPQNWWINSTKITTIHTRVIQMLPNKNQVFTQT